MATRKFLDVSSLSFVQGLDISVKESPIAKHSIRGIRGRSIFLRIPFICDKLQYQYTLRWYISSISPELMLIRPCDDGSMQLVNLLNKRAVYFQDSFSYLLYKYMYIWEEGIRGYMLLFNDPSLVGLNNEHTDSK
ncbi:unnamed protein product [Rotaria sp. Silwood2]|nr:unnamed protein product [Rotaria sp. Silwood2]CAF4628951.1 unnamed protein product [Rotaria sp. Silwood2]